MGTIRLPGTPRYQEYESSPPSCSKASSRTSRGSANGRGIRSLACGRVVDNLCKKSIRTRSVLRPFVSRLLNCRDSVDITVNHFGLRRNRSREGSGAPHRVERPFFHFSRCRGRRSRRPCPAANRRRASCSHLEDEACRAARLRPPAAAGLTFRDMTGRGDLR